MSVSTWVADYDTLLANRTIMSVTPKTADANVSGARRPLRVLIVEDSEPDTILLCHALERGGFHVTHQRVDTAPAMAAALNRQPWDLILADHAMPCFSAPEALELLKSHHSDIPFIIVSGHIDEDTAVAAMRAGAHDYIMKNRLARLVPAVERELREAAVRRAQQRTEEELEIRVERRTADLKAANLKLQNVLEERRRLENELLEIAENERRRIGFDLHDDLGQKLTGVSLMLKGLEQRLRQEGHPGCAELGKIHELINDVIHHTHNLAHQFSSLDMRGDDLTAALKGLAGNVKKMFNVSCVCIVRGEIPTLPQHIIAQLYKIAQEAVSNAIKHGKASQVSLGLSRPADKLVLTIRNNGAPFSAPAEGARSRMGLRIMKYRASTIGASFEIKPSQKNGTVVTCVLPVKTAPRPPPRERQPAPARNEQARAFRQPMFEQSTAS